MRQPLFIMAVRTTSDGLEFQDNPQASLGSEEVQSLQIKTVDFFGAIQDFLMSRGFQKEALRMNMTFAVRYDLEIPEALAEKASTEPEVEKPDTSPRESSL
jgi:hypothetical protein